MCVCRQAVNQLVAPNGWIDSCMSMGREGLFELIRKGYVFTVPQFFLQDVCVSFCIVEVCQLLVYDSL